jgi:hypothetical protein
VSAIPSGRRRPHEFEEDPELSREYRARRSWCRWCGLPGEPGDDRHPLGAPSVRPPVPAEAIELDRRRLGERPDRDHEDQAVTRDAGLAAVPAFRT